VGVRLPVGSLSVSKSVTGSGDIPDTFEATAACTIGGEDIDLGLDASLTLDKDGTPVRIDGIPVGAGCMITENGDVGSFGEESRSVSPTGGAITITQAGTSDDTVPAAQAVTLTNDYDS